MTTIEKQRQQLLIKKDELDGRLNRIKANVRRGLEPDSRERAQQLEDREVVDALGNEAREELEKITVALQRIDSGEYDQCADCGGPVGSERLEAYPYASACIDCANMDELSRARS